MTTLPAGTQRSAGVAHVHFNSQAQAIAEIQLRLPGATPGQLSLAGAEAGQLSLAQAEAGQLSIATDAGGQLD